MVYDEYVGINCFNVSNVVIYNNTVIDCTGFAIAVHAVSTQVPEHNVAVNNVVRMQQEVLFYENAVANSVVENNVYEKHGNAYYFSNGFHDFESWQSERGFDTQGREGLLQLQDPVALDFRPTETSLAVDAGRPTTALLDFSGIPVPQGATPDAGAYELVSTVQPEGEGVEGEAGDGEGSEEGQPVEGEGDSTEGDGSEGEAGFEFHAADLDENLALSLSEVLRVVQLFTLGDFRCAPESEDGFATGDSPRDCAPHSGDYTPQDWRLSFLELLRVMQLFNAGGYEVSESGEDGFDPVVK